MERIQPQSKSKEQYTREFVVLENEVPRTIGLPSYAGMVQPIREAIITNLLIAFADSRDLIIWGMLWMILNKHGSSSSALPWRTTGANPPNRASGGNPTMGTSHNGTGS